VPHKNLYNEFQKKQTNKQNKTDMKRPLLTWLFVPKCSFSEISVSQRALGPLCWFGDLPNVKNYISKITNLLSTSCLCPVFVCFVFALCFFFSFYFLVLFFFCYLLLLAKCMCGLLTKREVKMAWYWPSSFFASLFMDRDGIEVHKLAKKKNDANIKPSWPNKLGQ